MTKSPVSVRRSTPDGGGQVFSRESKKLSRKHRRANLKRSGQKVIASSVGLCDDHMFVEGIASVREKVSEGNWKGSVGLGNNGNSSESRYYPTGKLPELMADSVLSAKSLKKRIKKKELTKEERIENLIQMKREMAFQRKYSPYNSHMGCGTRTISDVTNFLVDLPMTLEIGKNESKFSGLAKCNSPWCRDCGRSRVYERASRISNHINTALFDGHSSCFFPTFTLKRHSDLLHQKLLCRKGIKAVQNHLNYLVKKGEFTYDMARAIDITFKPFLDDVYHLHLHVVVIFSDRPSMEEARERLIKPWCEALGDFALESVQDMQRIMIPDSVEDTGGLGMYMAKAGGLGLELSASSRTKRGRKGLSFSELVTHGANEGSRYREVYREFLSEIKGTNTLTFSRKWPKYEEEPTEAKENVYEIEIPRYWQRKVLQNQSPILILIYAAYYRRKPWIIRDFEFLMRRAITYESCEDLSEKLGFTKNIDYRNGREYLWDLWYNNAFQELGLDSCRGLGMSRVFSLAPPRNRR